MPRRPPLPPGPVARRAARLPRLLAGCGCRAVPGGTPLGIRLSCACARWGGGGKVSEALQRGGCEAGNALWRALGVLGPRAVVDTQAAHRDSGQVQPHQQYRRIDATPCRPSRPQPRSVAKVSVRRASSVRLASMQCGARCRTARRDDGPGHVHARLDKHPPNLCRRQEMTVRRLRQPWAWGSCYTCVSL